MALLSPTDRQRVQAYLQERLTGPVAIHYFTQHESVLTIPGQECAYCQETRELLEEVSALSEQIALTTHDFVTEQTLAEQYGIDKIPGFVLTGAAKGHVRFFGIPAGYEFSTLIEDLVDVGSGTTKLSEQTRQRLQRVSQPLHIQVFVTPT
jgi:alkyl hydroperoxide reductase subunit AhpF